MLYKHQNCSLLTLYFVKFYVSLAFLLRSSVQRINLLSFLRLFPIHLTFFACFSWFCFYFFLCPPFLFLRRALFCFALRAPPSLLLRAPPSLLLRTPLPPQSLIGVLFEQSSNKQRLRTKEKMEDSPKGVRRRLLPRHNQRLCRRPPPQSKIGAFLSPHWWGRRSRAKQKRGKAGKDGEPEKIRERQALHLCPRPLHRRWREGPKIVGRTPTPPVFLCLSRFCFARQSRRRAA